MITGLNSENYISINNINAIKHIDVFNCRTVEMRLEKDKLVEYFNIFKNHCQGLGNKDMVVSKEKKELDSLMSQMKYNIGILNTRTRNVEVGINRFDKVFSCV